MSIPMSLPDQWMLVLMFGLSFRNAVRFCIWQDFPMTPPNPNLKVGSHSLVVAPSHSGHYGLRTNTSPQVLDSQCFHPMKRSAQILLHIFSCIAGYVRTTRLWFRQPMSTYFCFMINCYS